MKQYHYGRQSIDEQDIQAVCEVLRSDFLSQGPRLGEFEERVQAMSQHAEIGGKYVTVTNHTTYSFGIDDQEFMPAFECEEPADFMHLMMALRESEASRWTERDTPIFVGKLVDVRAALDSLDGAPASVRASD